MKELKDLKILQDYVLVEGIIENEEVDGLVKPSQYDDKASYGVVLRKGEASQIPVGATVYFNKYSSVTFPFNNIDYLIVRDEDIAAYIE